MFSGALRSSQGASSALSLALDKSSLLCHKSASQIQTLGGRVAMVRMLYRSALMLAFCVGLANVVSCTLFSGPVRQAKDPPPADIQATRIEYVDSDGFDALLETSLSNNDPVIIVQTRSTKPDWEGRLNAWIGAWNMGGKVEQATEKRKVRLQAPLLPSVTVDKDSIREFGGLVENFMDRVDRLARESAAWWAEERVLRRRVELLKPYNLRFHQDEDHFIQIIFYNGRYSNQYAAFMKSVIHADSYAEEESWRRTFSFSCPSSSRVAKGQP